MDLKWFGSREPFRFYFSMLCFAYSYKDKQANTSFLVEIEPAALSLLLNLEVKFPINAEQAGIFSSCIELLSKRKLENWKWSWALPQQCRGWGCNKSRHKHLTYTLLNLWGCVSCCLTCRHKHRAHANFFIRFQQAPLSIRRLSCQHVFFILRIKIHPDAKPALCLTEIGLFIQWPCLNQGPCLLAPKQELGNYIRLCKMNQEGLLHLQGETSRWEKE